MKNLNTKFIIICVGILIAIILPFVMPIIKHTSYENKLSETRSSVVTIVSGLDTESGLLTTDVVVGSGFCYSDDGKILTNYHNITSDNITIITSDNQMSSATLIAKNETYDIAIIKANNVNLKAIKFGNSDDCKIGESVFSISTPISTYLKNTYSEGFITNLNISGFSKQYLLQTNIDLSPGCSGAPLFDKNFCVVGMTSFKSTEFGAEGLGFAIPSKQLEKSIYNLENNIDPIDLLIEFNNDLYQKYGIPRKGGITINKIDENSIAKDNLIVGDEVNKVNGQTISNIVEFYEQVNATANGELTLTIKRDGQEMDIHINLK